MSAKDQLELAAIRVLARLKETEGIDLVSTHGVNTLASSLARFLIKDPKMARAGATAEWLIEQHQVGDLFASDEDLERLLQEEWDVALRQAASERTQAPKPAFHAEFEAKLQKTPGDLQLSMIYGDWLQSEGDPLGGLIARQIAAEEQPHLQREAADFLKRHQSYFLGRLAEYVPRLIELDWRRGFVHAAKVGAKTHTKGEFQGAILLGWLLDLRIAKWMRSLELRAFGPYQHDVQQEMARVLFSKERPALAQLSIVDPDARMSSAAIELTPAAKALPNLERLSIRAGAVELERSDFSRLKRLSIEVSGGAERHVNAIALMAWPRLRALGLSARTTRPFDRCLERALTPRKLPALRVLRIFSADDASVEWLAESKLVEQLRVLDLSDGYLSAAGAAHIEANAARFSKLAEFRLLDSKLPSAVLSRLKAACPKIQLQ